MYGFNDKSTAEEKAEMLRKKDPSARFEVAPHSYWDTPKAHTELDARTWGVKKWVKQDHLMGVREVLDGFVWF
jgi:hypothetical protein